ncbi:MAG: precorrin-2 C(20)-methyltransferase, partial [Hominilimicola sp.]
GKKTMAKFYSVGVGAGDGSYITLGAMRALEAADIIAVPVKKTGGKSTALEIIRKEFNTDKKEILELEFSMSSDTETRQNSRQLSAEKIVSALNNGKNIAMITLGDVSVYSTCSYVHRAVKDAGHEFEIIPGITSFCAAADKAQISLCEGNESVAVIPSLKSPNLEKYIDDFDTIIIMKAGNDTDAIYNILERHGLENNAIVSSCVGMEHELIEPIQKGKEYGYFTTVIVKKH